MQIWLPNKIQTRRAKRTELSSIGICSKCEKAFAWRIQQAEQYAKPEDATEEHRTEAMRKFLEYKRRRIGPCCIPDADRKLISASVDLIVYNDFTDEDLQRLKWYM